MVRYGFVLDEAIASSSVLRAVQHLTAEPTWWVGSASALPNLAFALLVVPGGECSLPEKLSYAGPTIAYGPVGSMASSLIRGSADYLAEPWTTEELLLRVARCDSVRVDRFGPIAFWGAVVTFRRRSIVFRPYVVQTLRTLAMAKGAVVSRRELARHVGAANSRAVDMGISRLRQGLRQLFAEDPAPCAVITVRGQGYRLVESPHVDNV